MNSSTNLREGLFVFFSLTFISLLNAGQFIEGQRMSAQNMNIQLTAMLELDRRQIEKIHSINLTYQTKVTGLLTMPEASHVEKVNRLLHQRNKEIIDVLTDDQQKVLYTYCTDLISFSGWSNESTLTLW